MSEKPENPQIIVTDEEIFEAHIGGKLSVELKAPLDTQRALSIAYTPGVAQVSRAIAGYHTLAARYTWANRLVAVVSDGSAVLAQLNASGQPKITRARIPDLRSVAWRGITATRDNGAVMVGSGRQGDRPHAGHQSPGRVLDGFLTSGTAVPRHLTNAAWPRCRPASWGRPSASRA